MKRKVIGLLLLFLVTLPPHIHAQQVQSFSEEYYQDALLSLLFPSFNNAITKHYGIQKKYDCTTITRLEKIYPNSFVFHIELKARKYEKIVEPPYELITATYDNKEGTYKMRGFKVEKLKNDQLPENMKCRGPVRE